LPANSIKSNVRLLDVCTRLGIDTGTITVGKHCEALTRSIAMNRHNVACPDAIDGLKKQCSFSRQADRQTDRRVDIMLRAVWARNRQENVALYRGDWNALGHDGNQGASETLDLAIGNLHFTAAHRRFWSQDTRASSRHCMRYPKHQAKPAQNQIKHIVKPKQSGGGVARLIGSIAWQETSKEEGMGGPSSHSQH